MAAPQALITWEFRAYAHRWQTAMRAIRLLRAEVTTITPFGFWVGAGGEELYIAFHEYPEFEHATVHQLSRIELVSATRLYWPCLDIDLDIGALRSHAMAASGACAA